MARTFITVRFRQPGVHSWPVAPEGSFLRHPHRHVFHFTVWLQVFHDDREVEFIDLKGELQAHMAECMVGEMLYSCENLAELVVRYLKDNYRGRAIRVWVEEDGENGGYVEVEADDKGVGDHPGL